MLIIDCLLGFPIKRLKGKVLDKNKNFTKRCWQSMIYIKGMKESLGYYEDPWTASFVHCLVRSEIGMLRNRFFIHKKYKHIKNVCNRYQIRKVLKGKEFSITFKSLDNALKEKKVLESVDWDFDLWVEGNDEYLKFPVAVGGGR